MLLRPRALTAATALALALTPAASRAADFPVTTKAELSSALATAATNGTPDRVLVAAGDYTGPFTYNGTEDIQVIGAGAASTVIHQAAKTGGLVFTQAGAAVRIADLGFTLHDTASALSVAGPATVERVAAVAEAGATGNLVYLLHGGSSVTGSSFTGDGTGRAVYFTGSGASTVTDSVVSGPDYALDVEGPGTTVTASRLRIEGAAAGVSALFAGSVSLTDSLIDLGAGSNVSALTAGDNNNTSSAAVSTIDAHRVSIVGDGTHDQYAARIYADSAGDDFEVHLHDSLIDGVTLPLVCTKDTKTSATGKLDADYSRVPAGSFSNCDAPVSLTHPAPLGDPGFVDRAGKDFRLLASSPLVDAGDPADLTAATDLGGLPRPTDGDGDGTARTDLGAYERAGVPPPVQQGPGTGTTGSQGPPVGTDPGQTAPDRVAPTLSKLKLTRTALQFVLSEPSAVSVTVQRKVHGKTKAVGRTVTVARRAGAQTLARSAAPLKGLRHGRYTVLLVARDAAGNASRATLALTVKR